MEVTLDKIELVKDRTGVSYKDAKEALEAAEGSVVDAIINIEENMDKAAVASLSGQSMELLEYLKSILMKGNVTKIVVKNNDGEVLLNVPVNVGLIGAALSPVGLVVAIAASIGFKCKIEIIKQDGNVIDVNTKAETFVDYAKEKASDIADKAKGKAGETLDNVTETVKEKLNKEKFSKEGLEDEINEGLEDLETIEDIMA